MLALRGRQFDRQGHAVEATADLGHERRFIAGWIRIRAGALRAVGEQFNRRVVDRQRWHPPGDFAGEADRFAAGDKNRQLLAGIEQRNDHLPGRVEQVLAVVEQQQDLRSLRNRTTVSIGERPGWSGRPKVRATVTGTTSGLVIGDRSAYQTPSPKLVVSWAAISIASRVLPDPPAPVSVTRRFTLRLWRTSAISAWRPTKEVSWAGRLCERTAFDVRRGGNSLRISEWQSCTTRSGRGKSCTGRTPSSVSHASAGNRSVTKLLVVLITPSVRGAPNRAAGRSG